MNAESATLWMEREIYRALCRYASALDRRDWSSLDSVFTEDASIARPGQPDVHGRAAIVAAVRSYFTVCGATQHLLGNLTVERTGPIGVQSHSYVRASHCGGGELAGQTYEVWCEYIDRWRCGADGWRIEHRQFVVRGELGSRRVIGLD
jgi:ketosteroid isomerase-like protein